MPLGSSGTCNGYCLSAMQNGSAEESKRAVCRMTMVWNIVVEPAYGIAVFYCIIIIVIIMLISLEVGMC